MNKVVFTNINIANSEDEIKNEELLKKLNIKKLEWEDIKDEKGNIVANKGSGYFSLFLENGNDIKELLQRLQFYTAIFPQSKTIY